MIGHYLTILDQKWMTGCIYWCTLYLLFQCLLHNYMPHGCLFFKHAHVSLQMLQLQTKSLSNSGAAAGWLIICGLIQSPCVSYSYPNSDNDVIGCCGVVAWRHIQSCTIHLSRCSDRLFSVGGIILGWTEPLALRHLNWCSVCRLFPPYISVTNLLQANFWGSVNISSRPKSFSCWYLWELSIIILNALRLPFP